MVRHGHRQDERGDRAGDDQPVADPLTEVVDLPVALVLLGRLARVQAAATMLPRTFATMKPTIVKIIGWTQETSAIGLLSTCGTTRASVDEERRHRDDEHDPVALLQECHRRLPCQKSLTWAM